MARQAPAPAKPATGIKQTIQARHGVATYVPQGFTIKIINTYGKQVVDTWAFALHAPPEDSDIDKGDARNKEDGEQDASKLQDRVKSGAGSASQAVTGDQETSKTVQETYEKPSDKVEEAKEGAVSKAEATARSAKDEAAEGVEKTENTTQESKEAAKEATNQVTDKVQKEVKDSAPKRKGWGSYIPSLPRGKPQTKKTGKPEADTATNDNMSKSWTSYLGVGGGQKEGSSSNTNSQKKGWSAYIPSGQGFSSYMPTKDALSSLAGTRDPTKSYAEQLMDFSKTPVGAAGMSVATGSGYAGSIYAAYRAYEQTAGDGSVPAMEYMSMMHSRASTLHLSPRVGDTLTSNLRAPLLTVVEDTSPGVHDTLIAACDPQRYKELGVKKWEEHGSCSENCVLALKEINERSGLKGKRAIGSDVTVNTVPAPLNLFMNIPWTQEGDVSFEAPTTKRGDYIKLRAERDVVVVMSACPQDVLSINGGKPMVAHFVVESSSTEGLKKAEGQEGEAKTVPENAKRRTSSRGPAPKLQTRKSSKQQVPQEPVEEAEEAKTEEATPAPQKPNLEPPNVKSPVSNPRPGKKAPRKLEKRTPSMPQSPGPSVKT